MTQRPGSGNEARARRLFATEHTAVFDEALRARFRMLVSNDATGGGLHGRCIGHPA